MDGQPLNHQRMPRGENSLVPVRASPVPSVVKFFVKFFALNGVA